jgi:hypothetical protein
MRGPRRLASVGCRTAGISSRTTAAASTALPRISRRYSASIEVPDDLQAKVEQLLQRQPDITWHRAVQLVVDPNAPQPEDNEEDDDGELEDEDLSDIDA